jgi:hypothetical protein
MMKLPRRNFLHLAAGSRIARAQTYPAWPVHCRLSGSLNKLSEVATTGNEARTHCAWSFLEIHRRIRCSRWSREVLRIGATAAAGECRCHARASIVIRTADHDYTAVDRR